MSIHFGVAYYPEHWPRERWETDAKLMQEMGVQVVRMAEFSWFKMEPQEGLFQFEWLEEAVALSMVSKQFWEHRPRRRQPG